ncbi:MAG: bifunctional phosphoribosyl-AMP cyclohydrolase/phosphoribosyl-ATP diphosphatase HisIE [Bacteroidetes Order II. Incertae sedis bacterium]|jgi:phosphoribosyl-AMP cyclohydrolase / phosphoribosyl-ATP pyrophosphohydrolase|nr:bifunctional phosphoribosyl-AMP cyclohydrolase/phosphoribosyl-ATP diphosphatase HisIE [Bacteroidetes Order II. bacterium]MBT4051624.1 bifunctional phosphoribosyl-AMP cyclohydrolase/phosphoribosyl-ATP diphosphatase HisIE [Bacteroidetes Order II. bacterium]MBT4603799.1 bifunctional phosphoribosyl-AMP cyclohydrolase/phosphoribosyl-ATP diphosphatase HisIE [Bacteroidetes Order II. bacterium]MBT5250432.1 bifunctional phosphoribosyl-AMP cyclohydrolase/phosphoribosyl-ATP diphosphatase HisIE [Bacteroi
MKSVTLTGDPIRFSADGLIPAVIQDNSTRRVLMLGYMNQESLDLTLQSGKVTFFSRSRQRLWEKGEESGNTLLVHEIRSDCDGDALLVLAEPSGPTCHTGADTCWQQKNEASAVFLNRLEDIVSSRIQDGDPASYTVRLVNEGVKKVAQKVGEEGVETALEGATGNLERLAEESADLLYHLIVLLKANALSLSDVISVLERRHR